MLNTKKHISEQFDTDLQHLFSLLLTMGSLVERQLNNAMQVIKGEGDITAEQVIKADKQVNAMEVAIDETCVTLIARRQPVAQDLRFIITVLKIASELERIGDTVDKLAQTVLYSNIPSESAVLNKLEQMAEYAIKMLHESLSAFTDMDLEHAIETYNQDRQMDQYYKQVCTEISELMKEEPDQIERLLVVLLCARALERIGDRSQNICEFIYYYLKGYFPKHEDIQA